MEDWVCGRCLTGNISSNYHCDLCRGVKNRWGYPATSAIGRGVNTYREGVHKEGLPVWDCPHDGVVNWGDTCTNCGDPRPKHMSQSPQAQAKVNPAPTIAEVMGAERQRAAARTRYAANSTQRAAHTLYTPPVPPAGLSLRLTWVDVVCLLQAVKRMEEDMPPNGLTDLIEKLENLDAVFQDINRRE